MIRYATNSDVNGVCKGKVSCLNRGIAFCKSQVRNAAAKFEQATQSGSWNDCLADLDENDEGDEDDGSDDEPFVVEENDGDEKDVWIPSRFMHSSVCVWEFPDHISQSTLDGRNGSNACSVIALVFAQGLHDTELALSEGSFLPPTWVHLMCGSIRIGNELYDRSLDSLPHHLLSAAEAAMVASSCIDASLSAPLPVRVSDVHQPSTLRHQLSRLCEGTQGKTSLYIVNNKTMLFVSLDQETIVLVDTHCHDDSGTVIALGKRARLDDFVSVCQVLISADATTYGNFVFVEF